MRSVSARLTLLFVLITALILSIFMTSLYLWVDRGLERDQDRAAAMTYRMFEERFLEEADEVRRGVHTRMDDVLEDFLAASEAVGEIRGPDGAGVFASKGFKAGRDGTREVAGESIGPEGKLFRLRIGVSDARRLQTLAELRRYFIVFCPLVLGLAWLLGYLFVRRALAPVGEMRRQAERISRANVSERVPEPVLPGEFADLARTFNEMLDRLDHAIQDLQNFAADAAHELRTPLATLRAEIETAVQQTRTPEEYERILGSVAEEVARMSHVVGDLFTLAKIDMRQYALQRERVRLGPLLDEVVEVGQAWGAVRRVSIVRDGGDAEVAGDPVALRRVFMNLVENGVKYNREGGAVRVGLERVDGQVRVCVSDTGMGIAAEHLPRLFNRFYRVDKARSRDSGGAGLGLAICKSFVEAHEGTIGVASVSGQGTTFTIDLPAAASPQPAALTTG